MFNKPGSSRTKQKESFIVSTGFFSGLEEFFEKKSHHKYTLKVISNELKVFKIKVEVC